MHVRVVNPAGSYHARARALGHEDGTRQSNAQNCNWVAQIEYDLFDDSSGVSVNENRTVGANGEARPDIEFT
jgi:hypothetical protein